VLGPERFHLRPSLKFLACAESLALNESFFKEQSTLLIDYYRKLDDTICLKTISDF
jgi:hypothetical protein